MCWAAFLCESWACSIPRKLVRCPVLSKIVPFFLSSSGIGCSLNEMPLRGAKVKRIHLSHQPREPDHKYMKDQKTPGGYPEYSRAEILDLFLEKGWARFVRLILAETPRTQASGAQARLIKHTKTKQTQRGESETLTSAAWS